MSVEMITDYIILICCQISFLYGFFAILIQKKPLYLKMIVMSVACMMVSRISVVLQYLTKGDTINDFNVSMLGLLGCFLFLFSANFGVIDSLADDGSSIFFKYRLISYVAPIILLASYLSVFLFKHTDKEMIATILIVLCISMSSKYHLKHIIFPDIEYGIIRAIRGYNAVALLLCISTTVWLISHVYGQNYLYLATGILISICCLIIIPLLQKEAKKWTVI